MALRNGSPALFKRMIALSLKKWRLEARLPQKDAAKRLDRTIQHISNIEAGQLPTAADLELLLGLYGKADQIPFMRDLLSAARKAKNWWTATSGAVPKWFDLFLGLESGAAELFTYNTIVVPGLLQTRRYAEAVLRGNPNFTREQLAKAADLRVGRQRILDRAIFRTVVDESVLYRQRGDTATMRDQLTHLIEMSKRPRIEIQVLPFDAGPTPAVDGGNFVVMTFPPDMEGDPGLVHLESLTGGTYVENADEIAEYRRAVIELRARAADPHVSRGIIERAVKEVT
ncbi:Scr1 family TA system antitoxin-like transcriptional regulator [Actinophytocola sp.]|uniref:Scr1 family TA system antitoxin-like transcriptional regulator n=1 Tax=Actinophytocola sp. TaxID=1872138 RepID=UPI002ED1E9DF